VNILFQDPEPASQCLEALTAEAVYYEGTKLDPTDLRLAKSYQIKQQNIQLSVRISFETDRKGKGARARSRYYLFHGEPTPIDDQLRFGDRDKNWNNVSPDEYRTAQRYKYRVVDEESDLFPEKISARTTRERSPIRKRNLRDLFPDKLDRKVGLAGVAARGDEETLVSRGAKTARARSLSPSRSGKSSDLAERIDSKWVKGDLLSEMPSVERKSNERRRRRRQAADLF
jgi:hypothetical protein